MIWENLDQKCHTSLRNPGFFISHKITSRRKKGLFESNFERDKKRTNTQTFLVDKPEKVYPVTPCMDIYKAKHKI